MDSLSRDLAERQAHGLYRRRRVMDSPQGVEVTVDGRPCLAFCSNDYLGLANHPEVIAAFKKAANTWGVGSGAAHLINGHTREHHALEEELAAFTGRERALLFSTGYMANVGTLSALCGRRDLILQDKLNHASLIDGALLSQARLLRYRHNDSEHLHELLQRPHDSQRIVIATDGVYSMDGDLAPLPALVELAQQHNALLMVDDAHGLGVLGAQGGGALEWFGLKQQQVPILMGTLGKAFGTFGAFVAGSDTLIETLIQNARSYIYTTALPAAVAAATRVALRLVQEEQWRRDKLHDLVAQLRNGAEQLGITLSASPTPIQPLLVGSAQEATRMSEALLQQGILVSAIRPPTVPQGSARLRITLSAQHEPHQVDRLLTTLASLR